MKVKKAVIAVAGYGTRFLPSTKAVPKELLAIVDKPVVQYLVEEAVQSGIEDVILVTRPGTQAIEDHFDSSRALEAQLAEQGKKDYLEMVQAIPRMANFAFVRQGTHLPYGNGSPALAARAFIGRDEPFVYMYGDDLVLGDSPCIKELIEVYERYQPAAVVAVQPVPRHEIDRYGIVRLKPGREPMEMESVIEKPHPDQAPSNLAMFGRFVLSPRILDILARRELGKGNELWLTDAINKLCQTHPVLVQSIKGRWLTTGDPLRFLIANVEYALRHPEVGPDFKAYLKSLDLSGV